MYAVYNYKAGSTAANVTADIIKLLTGETNLASLSTDCVTANSSIVSTVAAGWTVHDAAAGSGAQVIKALNQDGTTYKYYKFNCTSTTVTQGLISEDWNATTHTATNSVNSGSTNCQSSWNAASGGYFYVYATAKNIIMWSYHTSAYQSIGGLMVLEFTRDTVLTGYPAFCQSYTTVAYGPFHGSAASDTAFQIPRYKKVTATGDTLASALTSPCAWVARMASVYFNSANAAFYRDASEANNVVVYKLSVGQSEWNSTGLGYRHLGECYDIYTAPISLGSPRDEITISGKVYVLHGQTSSASCLLVPKE